jgi:hypothetical protein
LLVFFGVFGEKKFCGWVSWDGEAGFFAALIRNARTVLVK